jgi:hypothetical protein
MTDRGTPAKIPTYPSPLSTAARDPSPSVVRARNLRVKATDEAHHHPSVAASAAKSSEMPYHFNQAAHNSRNISLALDRSQADPGSKKPPAGGELVQFLGDSWTQSWTSVQAFASTLISGSDGSSRATGPSQPRPRRPRDSQAETWGPPPPPAARAIDEVGAGSLSKRQDALRAAKTASVLESHEGVNGGLDITGRHKRRISDEIAPVDGQPEEQLVYVHKVESNDTYAGIILRYKCREDIFRKSNGLWSRDSVQTRRWLIIPVDACEIKGRPCEAPSWLRGFETNLLTSTPSVIEEASSANEDSPRDYFSSACSSGANAKHGQTEELPWSHVRWVQIDSFRQPVEIVRVARRALGYFPPRRKKSIRTASPLSTPRQSSDLSSVAPNSNERPNPRRLSSLGGRPHVPGTPLSSQSRTGSDATDNRPAWMRRPGGVGSMSRNVRAPGPDKDYFNSWARKHLPGLNIEDLPSMSVMGSETAHFGFNHGATSIVEGSFEDGRDTSFASRQGTGLDRAAAVVENWLRGALAKRPSTPLLGGRPRPRGMSADGDITDLIELTDTTSEDGKASHEVPSTLLGPLYSGTTARADSSTSVRARPKPGTESQDAHRKQS